MPIDSNTIVTAVGAKLAYDLFGPNAKYLGGKLKGLTKAGAKNIERIFKKAAKRKAELGIESGAIAPRLLPSLLERAYYCDDELVASYLGGVMCSAISPAGRDDRAITFVKLIDGLSSYALRAHCIVYASVARQSKVRLSAIKQWLLAGHGVTVVFDEKDLHEKMGFVEGENVNSLLEHAFVSLSANDLSMQGMRPVMLQKSKQTVRWLHLTPRGVELFCWGNGFGQAGIDQYFAGGLPSSDADALATIPSEVKLGIVSYT